MNNRQSMEHLRDTLEKEIGKESFQKWRDCLEIQIQREASSTDFQSDLKSYESIFIESKKAEIACFRAVEVLMKRFEAAVKSMRRDKTIAKLGPLQKQWTQKLAWALCPSLTQIYPSYQRAKNELFGLEFVRSVLDRELDSEKSEYTIYRDAFAMYNQLGRITKGTYNLMKWLSILNPNHSEVDRLKNQNYFWTEDSYYNRYKLEIFEKRDSYKNVASIELKRVVVSGSRTTGSRKIQKIQQRKNKYKKKKEPSFSFSQNVKNPPRLIQNAFSSSLKHQVQKSDREGHSDSYYGSIHPVAKTFSKFKIDPIVLNEVIRTLGEASLKWAFKEFNVE